MDPAPDHSQCSGEWSDGAASRVVWKFCDEWVWAPWSWFPRTEGPSRFRSIGRPSGSSLVCFFFRVCSGLAWAMSVESHFHISFLRGLCRFWLLGCLDWLGPSTVVFWLFCFGFGSLSGACLFASPSWGSVLVLVGWLTG